MVVQIAPIFQESKRGNNHPNTKQKKAIKELYNYRCLRCGKHQSEVEADKHGTTLTLHHIQRVISGGGHSRRNMVVLCRCCHAIYHEKIEGSSHLGFWDWICSPQ